jgi:hypothetical protein
MTYIKNLYRICCFFQAINPWLNIDCSARSAKTRSITSKKIEINYGNNMIRPQNITPFIGTELTSPTVCTFNILLIKLKECIVERIIYSKSV